MSPPARVLALLTLVGWLTTGVSRADQAEKEKAVRDLPRAIRDAIKAKFPDAELVSAETEKEDGQTVYEVAIKHRDQKMELTLTAGGTLLEIEKVIRAEDLPRPVADALSQKYPRAIYRRIEEITKLRDGTHKLEGYEVLLVTAQDKSFEVVLSPEGRITKEEAKEKSNR